MRDGVARAATRAAPTAERISSAGASPRADTGVGPYSSCVCCFAICFSLIFSFFIASSTSASQ